jgi:centrosomal protein CEP290
MEVKFRAKYHGQHALEMGLSPDQLLLVEQLVDDIKHGNNDEARVVDQMQHRVSDMCDN